MFIIFESNGYYSKRAEQAQEHEEKQRVLLFHGNSGTGGVYLTQTYCIALLSKENPALMAQGPQ